MGIKNYYYTMDYKNQTMKNLEHQLKIRESNRKRNNPEMQDAEMVLVEKDLLEKLKNFDYWKEWRNKK